MRIAFALVLAPLLLPACIAEFCTQKGCGPATVSLCGASPETSRVRVCRSTDCSEIVDVAAPEPTFANNGLGVIGFRAGCGEASVHKGTDGEQWTLTTWDAEGNELDNKQWTATYELSYANGYECDKDNPCYHPTLVEKP